jgi:hypothetical protein
VDVPVAALTGLGNTGGVFCRLFGTTTPFTAAQLATLYPTRVGYLRLVAADAAGAVAHRVLLLEDAVTIVGRAARSGVGG